MRPSSIRGASDRTLQTIHAAEVLHDHAVSIAAACADAAAREVVVAAVTRDQVFGGIWTVAHGELAETTPRLEGDGWALIFSPGTSVEEIEARCLQLAEQAFARWLALRRLRSRRR